MGKAKVTIDLDVAKGLWQEYANLIKARWTKALAMAVASEDMEAIRAVGKSMESFSFDFNIANKKAARVLNFSKGCKYLKEDGMGCAHRYSKTGQCPGDKCSMDEAAEAGEVL